MYTVEAPYLCAGKESFDKEREYLDNCSNKYSGRHRYVWELVTDQHPRPPSLSHSMRSKTPPP
ncbi:hypothetical protein DCAR_0207723 [Daucus carota subsp. sativus]|uniref:Uncharacterized protein n=1 Tax=Daucus carota subsp. sativus TaxID=79200 RepID=A0A166E2X8_DAUCS|nr:hypothetical protein DCAR_0207723 [Daucus carota subsp. sativus]